MKPYYEDDSVTLYHGDAREVTAWLEADVLVTDPPYGTQFTAANPRGGYGRRGNAAGNRKGAPLGRTLDAAIIANDDTTEVRDEVLGMWGARGPALVFGSPRMPDPPIEVADRLVWDKKRPGMNGGPWRYRHESIFVSAGFERRSNASVSILTDFPEQSFHIHGKPIGLMTALVDCAPLGATIADPFSGSGSTLVAAKNLGRKAIGVELEERYCEIAARRLSQDVLDFGGEAS